MNRKQRRSAAKQARQKGSVMSLDEAMSRAIKLHQEKKLDQAEEIYLQILGKVPDHPDALHFLGLLKHQRGFSDEAIELIQKAININSNYTDAYNNLGNVLKEQGRLEEAEAAYQSCLSLDPNNANALNNLGTVLRDQEKYEDAINAYKRAIERVPEHADAYHNMGNALKKLDRVEEAIAAYRKSIAIHPYDAAAYKSLGTALYREQRTQEAVGVFEQWLSFDPDNATARHMLAACSGQDVPTQASDAFIEETFDQFAGSFDDALKRLEYRAPELVLTAVSGQIAESAADLEILDAGCGTGLCGPLIRPYAKHLVGVDLSQGMVEKARGRQVYDELVICELTKFVQSQSSIFDLIISADTLCYFGALEAILKGAHQALQPHGLMVFTLEKINHPTAAEGYRLNPHGRYSHSQDYVEAALKATGLQKISVTTDILRKERGEAVVGLIVVAKRQ